jgi:hypothetical protein
MKVTVKSFDVEMELKNNGIELEIRDPSDNFLGDLVVTKTKLIWCKGRTSRANGKTLALNEFIKMMEGLK